jgi:hypothetical protein
MILKYNSKKCFENPSAVGTVFQICLMWCGLDMAVWEIKGKE